MPTAVKLSDEIVASAREESRIWSRSMTQQVEHWARIGRLVERTGAVSHDRIRAALTAELEYDELSSEERAVVLGQLERDVFMPRGDGALAKQLRASGRSLAALDDSGKVTEVRVGGTKESGGG